MVRRPLRIGIMVGDALKGVVEWPPVRTPFPVLNPPEGCAKFVHLEQLDADDAVRIHGQTLEQLAEKGGLGPMEICALYVGTSPAFTFDDAVFMVNLIEY